MEDPNDKQPKKQPAKKKLTRAQLTADKLKTVREQIDKRVTPGDIKRQFATKYKTTPRAAERFITEVYEHIRKEVGRDPADHKADAYTFWTAIVSDPVQPLKDRMRAQENLDRILGNHAPNKTATTDTTGKDVTPDRRLTLTELDAALDRLAGEEEPPPCVASPQ